MNGLLVIMAFGPLLGLWPSSFFVLLRDHGSHRNIFENVQFPAKIQHAPKSKTKSKTVKFGCQVAGQYMNHPEEFTKTTPNYIIKWVLKERQHDYRKDPQAHRYTVVAFHPEIFRVSLFIFSQRMARRVKVLSLYQIHNHGNMKRAVDYRSYGGKS